MWSVATPTHTAVSNGRPASRQLLPQPRLHSHQHRQPPSLNTPLHLYSGTRKAGELPSPAWLTTAASTEASSTMATVRPEGCSEDTVELTCRQWNGRRVQRFMKRWRWCAAPRSADGRAENEPHHTPAAGWQWCSLQLERACQCSWASNGSTGAKPHARSTVQGTKRCPHLLLQVAVAGGPRQFLLLKHRLHRKKHACSIETRALKGATVRQNWIQLAASAPASAPAAPFRLQKTRLQQDSRFGCDILACTAA